MADGTPYNGDVPPGDPITGDPEEPGVDGTQHADAEPDDDDDERNEAANGPSDPSAETALANEPDAGDGTGESVADGLEDAA